VVRRQERVQRLCPLRYATGEFTEAAEQALALANAAWPEHAADSLCSVPAVVCVSPPCEAPGDFVPAFGDVDSGRRLYASGCASCHGSEGEGDIAPPLCSGPGCPCSDCVDHATLAARIAHDMPPEGSCTGECADDVAAFILHELIEP
jgi:cytochrome c5